MYSTKIVSTLEMQCKNRFEGQMEIKSKDCFDTGETVKKLLQRTKYSKKGFEGQTKIQSKISFTREDTVQK